MTYIGIGLSKEYFDAMLLMPGGKKHHAQFKSSEKGLVQFDHWVKKYSKGERHICMEATNIYWEALAQARHDQGDVVSVVNPVRIKGFAMSQLRRNKTDKQDSDVIVEFCQAVKPEPWKPPTPDQRKLRSLVRGREALIKSQTQQKNRLATCQDDDVRQAWHAVLTTLQAEIDRLEQQIAQFIAEHPALCAQAHLLRSVTGFGPVFTHLLLAEMYDLADYKDAHAAAADAGVNPAHYESGDTVRRRPKMSKVGKASLRAALYWPAITAIRHNPVVRALAERLERLHKPKKVIIGAAMRKLMHLA